ncbi:MAG TPA: hypothetical protein V6C71_27085 [Coleofasciculaceae cyanobacterium]
MATNKKAISAYLPSDLEEYLTEYCIKYDITRKDKLGEIKPALGTAIVEILRIFFSSENIPSPLPDNVSLLPSNVVTEDKLTEVLSEFKNSSNVANNLPSNVLTIDDLNKRVEAVISEAIPKAIVTLKSNEEFIRAIALEVQKIANITTGNIQYSSENALKDEEVEENQQTTTQIDKASLAPIFEEVEEEKPTEPTQSVSLTDAELAKQLGMSKSTIYRYRTGKPKQSPGYQQVMNNWKSQGDRWYKQGE